MLSNTVRLAVANDAPEKASRQVTNRCGFELTLSAQWIGFT